MLRKYFCTLFSAIFILQSLTFNLPAAYANSSLLVLPEANQMLLLSSPVQSVMLQGLQYDPQKPFQFEFILQQGDNPLPLGQLRDKGMDLVRYFMAAMTMTQEDLWVNLSPYEKNRIIPGSLGVTRLGSDMLVQDYVLKQLASSLTFPDSKTGGDFWQEIYREAKERFGRTDMPVSTFNKVWIVPDYAEVLVKGNAVIIASSHLKVMMEQDYLAVKKASCGESCLPVSGAGNSQNLASDVMRQIIIPILDKEVNTGSHFAPLRQMFHAVVLAEWYKRNLKASLFNQLYADRHKVAGIDEVSQQAKDAIYKRYLSAYKKGVYNFIREDADPVTNEIIPRKYFSGGLNLSVAGKIIERRDSAQLSEEGRNNLKKRNAYLLDVGALPAENAAMSGFDGAMTSSNPPATARKFIRSKTIMFLDEMRGRWSSKADDPQDVRQLVEELKFKNESIWVHWAKLPTPFGDQWALMVRVRHHGKITRGGVRVQYNWQGEDIKKLFQLLATYNPSEVDERELSSRVGVQMATALAIGMTFKNEAEDLGVGGGKGIIYFPQAKDLSKEQLEALKNIAFYHYAYELTKDKMIGPDIDGLAPDVNSGPVQMQIATEGHLAALLEQGEDAFEWKNDYMALLKREGSDKFTAPSKGSYRELYEILLMIKENKDKYPQKYSITDTPLKDAYDKWGNEHPGLPMPANATFTGKPIEKGGIEGREQATGDGSVEVAMYYYELLGKGHAGKTASVQGLGNVGIYTALTAAGKGFVVKYLGDLGVTLYKEDGFSYSWINWLRILIKNNPGRKILELVRSNEVFFKGVEILPEGDVIEAPVDILFLAATQNVITAANCDKVRAGLVAEPANDPVTSEAERSLYNRGIVTLSDTLVNAGGVSVSIEEQVQALTGRKISKDQVLAYMHETLRRSFKKYFDLWTQTNRGKFNPAFRITLRDVIKQEVVKSLAREQMAQWIDRNNGEINEIIKNEYKVVISEAGFEERVKELGLLDYLYKVKGLEFQRIRSRILEILDENRVIENVDVSKLKDWLYLALPEYDPTSQRVKFKSTLALARTVLRVIAGKGEFLSSAAARLTSLGFDVPRVRALRRAAINTIVSRIGPESEQLVAFLTHRVRSLDDAGDNTATVAADGGIDFDASHMLIDQEGEANFKSQTTAYDPRQWQQTLGFVPVFLRMKPVNISLFMGIKG